MTKLPLLALLLTTTACAPKVLTASKQESAYERTWLLVAKAHAADLPHVAERKPAQATTVMNRAVRARDPQVPVIVCPRGTADLDVDKVDALINELNITFYPDRASIEHTEGFRSFLYELAKFPRPLLDQLALKGGGIRLIAKGHGIASDPLRAEERDKRLASYRKIVDWNRLNPDRQVRTGDDERQIQRAYLKTADGRPWSETSGSGGVFQSRQQLVPTRINVNELYEKTKGGAVIPQGTVNLFLHEHGHALDNAFRQGGMSHSGAWARVLQDPRTSLFLPKILSDYEYNSRIEGFAELFAYYHSCDESREQLRVHAPSVHRFFSKLQKALPFR